MRQKIYSIPIVLASLLATCIAVAQKNDTIPGRIEVVMDGNKAVNKTLSIVYDSADLVKARMYVENGKLYIINDTFPKQNIKARFVYKGDSASFKRKDSLYKRYAILFKRNDSLFRKNQVEFRSAQKARMKTDTSFKRTQLAFNKSRQLFKQTGRLDSLRKLNWQKDSLRIKKDLKALNSHLQKLKDSMRSPGTRKKKVVSREVDCNKNVELFIENVGRRLTIKTGADNKIKLETVLVTDNGETETVTDWGKTFNLAITGDKNKVIIKKVLVSPKQDSSTLAALQNNSKTNFKSSLTIYVPASVKIKIEHRYNELIIDNDLITAEFDLFNSAMRMKDAQKASIKSRYGSVRAGAIKTADLELMNCNFSSTDLQTLVIDSKYSTITLKNVDLITMKSVSDKYIIARVKDITGTKSFGEMKITELGNSFTLNGSSADVQIESIDGSAKSIQLINKYADVKFPVQQLQNYTVKFDGANSKVFTPFEKNMAIGADSTKRANPSFTKTVGDVMKEYTAFVVNCSSCSVDFR